MTEAIDETMLENQSQENLEEEPAEVRNEAGYANMNRWPEKMNPMDAETFFRYQDPNPIQKLQQNEDDIRMIEIPKRAGQQSPRSKSSAVKKEEDQSHLTQFTQNPNLGNVIK